jgi:hypothetical protein
MDRDSTIATGEFRVRADDAARHDPAAGRDQGPAAPGAEPEEAGAGRVEAQDAEAQDAGRPRRRSGNRIKVAQTLPSRPGDDSGPDEMGC